MKSDVEVAAWVRQHPLSATQVDCAVAVMLKVLDGKCKMSSEEKQVMRHLYHAVKGQQGNLLGEDIHWLIDSAERRGVDETGRDFIYEKRVLAETMISRPVMKGFKKLIRQQGLFEPTESKEESAAHAVA